MNYRSRKAMRRSARSTVQPSPVTPNDKTSIWDRRFKHLAHLELIVGFIAIPIVVIIGWNELESLVEQRRVNAWQLLSMPTSGNAGKATALAFLNKDHYCLPFTDYCMSPRQSLRAVDFGRGANLSNTNFEGADLSLAKLQYADLSFANLSNTWLRETDFTGATFQNTNVSGSRFDPLGLTESQLEGLCITDQDSFPDLTDRGTVRGFLESKVTMKICKNQIELIVDRFKEAGMISLDDQYSQEEAGKVISPEPLK